ncbi:MAG TPA: hypothetical protein PLZ20_14540 [Nitrospira sp.]|nr:hypothetical protein [Nitrospira sp.]
MIGRVIFAMNVLALASAAGAQDVSRSAEPPAKSELIKTEDPSLLAPRIFVVPLPALPADIPKLGEGFDLLNGQRRAATCIEHGGVTPNVVEALQASLSEITDDEMFWRKLNTSIEVKANYAGYSGGGSYSETNESRTTTSKTSVVTKATLITTADNLLPSRQAIPIGLFPSTRIDLSPPAYNLVANGKFGDFRALCGDGYIAQIAYGGHIYSTLEFSKLDFEKKREIVASINASGPGDVFSGNAKSNLQEQMTKHSTSLKIQFSREGGNFQLNPTNRDEVVAEYKKFAEDIRKNPKVIFISVARYDSLASMSALPNKIKSYWVYADQGIRQLLRLQSVRNDVASALPSVVPTGLPPDPNAEFITLPQVERGNIRRSESGFKKTLGELQSLTAELGKWVAKCLTKATETECTPEDPSFEKYDDLLWRARAPIARADIRQSDVTDLQALAGAGATPNPEASCYFAQIIRSNVIRRIAAVRQRYDNAGNEARTKLAEDEVLAALGIKREDCGPLFGNDFKIKSFPKLVINESLLPRP